MDFLTDLGVKLVLTTPLVGAYVLFALGVVFIYRASKVLNLAHGSMAMIPAFLAHSLTGAVGVLPAALIAVACGGGLSVGVERIVVRRLRGASATAQTVGTAAVLGLFIAVAARIWGTSPIQGPSLFPERSWRIGNSAIDLGDIGLLVVALGLAAVFMALFRYTHIGLAMRCAADNRQAAWLMGINPDRTTAMAWFFAGLLAALGGVLLSSVTILHPYTLSLQVLPAFVAALIGGLESMSGAVYGSVIVGLTLGTIPALGGLGDQVGAPQVALALIAFVAMSLRGSRYSVADASGGLVR